MNEVPAAAAAPGPAGLPSRPEGRGTGWSLRKWLTLVALVFVAQVVIIFVLGEKHPPLPRIVEHVPQLTLADGSSELIALGDPTLFALPHENDFASAVWNKTPANPSPDFRWTEPPGELLRPDGGNLGAVFLRFMRTNPFVAPALDFKPEPALREPTLSLRPMFAETSSLRIEGELAQRKLLSPVQLVNWPYADVIAPSRVQVLVDGAGDVVSAVLLPPASPAEAASHYYNADTNALGIARSLRFAPAPHLTIGQLIFDWQTVAPPASNSPSAFLP